MTVDGAALLVVAHGSRDQAARVEFLDQVRALSAALPDLSVRYAVLEFPGEHAPSIGDAVDALPADVRRLLVLPLFLFDAGHVRNDIPAELATAAGRHPGLDVRMLPQVSADDGLLEILVDRVRTARAAAAPHEPWAVLVVGAGTSSAAANAELVRMTEMLRGEIATSIVEPAFVSLAHPTVAEGIARCAEQGARQVVTVHYFLNTGVLARRIETQAGAEVERLGVKLTVGQHFGPHQRLTESLARRVRAALLGDAAVRDGEESKNNGHQPSHVSEA